MTRTKAEATIEDLYKVEGRAEIVDGEIVVMNPTGYMPSWAAGQIYFHLRLYLQNNHISGVALTDNIGFAVDLPHRKSFSPDVAFFQGKTTGMKFLEGAPVFAVEVRSEGDYGASAEKKIAEKRADYFAAGTQVVWDVDLLGDEIVKVYRNGESTSPVAACRRGETADAEPVIPGWRFPISEMFSD